MRTAMPVLTRGADPPGRISGWRLLAMIVVAYAVGQILSALAIYALIGFPLSLAQLQAQRGALLLGRNQALPIALGELAMLGVGWLFLRRRIGYLDLGLAAPRWTDLADALSLLAVTLLLSLLFGLLLHTGDVKAQVGLASRLRSSWWEVPLIAVSAGFSEEILIRGYLLQGLWRLWPRSRVYGIAVTSVAFGLAHLAWGLAPLQLLFYIALGVIFALSVLRRGSLWPAIVAHAAWDGLALILLSARLPG